MKKKPGYEAEIVLAFIEHHGTTRADGRYSYVNEFRITDSHRDMIERWRGLEVVPLERIDSVLLKYGLMLWELEHFAERNYGRCGYVDPYAEPAELVA